MAENQTEFNLSNFRQIEQNVWTYEEEQVKEFIRLLKEFIKDNQEEKECNYILEKIDKLAGDKLI